MMEAVFPGRVETEADLLTDKDILAIARKRWPQVNGRTTIAPTAARKLTVPVCEDDRPIMERWTAVLEGDEPLMYGQVTIALEPIEDVPGVMAMGYDAQVNILAVTLTN